MATFYMRLWEQKVSRKWWLRHKATLIVRERKIFIIFPITGGSSAVFQPTSTKVAVPAVPLIQFLGLIKRRLVLVKLLRAGIEGVGLVIHLVWDELPIVSVSV